MNGFSGIFSGSGQVTINGVTYKGTNVVVKNGVVFVDGKRITEEGAFETGVLEVRIVGGPVNVQSDASVSVEGNVEGSVSANGGVTVTGDVRGNVDTNGGVTVNGSVGGNIDAMGSVTCGDVRGSIDAIGSVYRRR